eukprot:GGOE01000755.1.p1 GENE.GGOE01000755.1~~GGOE01000755.1.p1  ORF type:complete len:618 (+),score=181.02 GGOE01000755.1:97-1854(+)
MGKLQAREDVRRRKRRRTLSVVPPKSQGLAVGWDLGDCMELGSTALQDLLLGVLAQGPLPKWVTLSQAEAAPHLCILTVPGLQRPLYSQAAAEACPWIARAFRRPLQTRIEAPLLRADSHLWSLWVMKNSTAARDDGKRTTVPDQAAVGEETDDSPDLPRPDQLEELLLTKEQLVTHGYPVVESDLLMPPGFRRLTVRREGQEEVPWVALDCEMCITSAGHELTRVAVVHGCQAVLYDQLVRPARPITDYLTHITGLTSTRMADVTKTLADVQRELSELIFADTVLVGHSLENDLRALKLVHDRVIDTAVLFSDPSLPAAKPSLRLLVHKYLGRSIQGYATSYYAGNDKGEAQQGGRRLGHDSVEDATACLDLVAYRVQQGPAFVPHLGLSNVLQAAHGAGRTVYCGGPADVLQKFAPLAGHVACTAEDGATAGQGEAWLKGCCGASSAALVWLHFRAFEAHYAKVDSAPSKQKAWPEPTEAECELLHHMDMAVRRLVEAAPVNTLFVLWSGQGPTHRLQGFRRLKEEAEEKLREGLLWLYAKNSAEMVPMPTYQPRRKPLIKATRTAVKRSGGRKFAGHKTKTK